MRPLTLLATLVLALMAAAPAQAQLPADVARIQAAVVELADAKRGAAGRVPARERSATRAMAACRTTGPGWRRIRAVRDASQRNAYRRGARLLWRDLSAVAVGGAALDTYRPFFTRFLARLERPLADPVLQAGADALRGRIAYLDAAYSFGSCRSFETLLRRVREFSVGGEDGVAGDYRAGRIYNTFARYVDSRRRRADARHGGSTHRRRLEAARERLVALGGDYGYASYFSAAYSLNR